MPADQLYRGLSRAVGSLMVTVANLLLILAVQKL